VGGMALPGLDAIGHDLLNNIGVRVHEPSVL
jgi:hypothetical protein